MELHGASSTLLCGLQCIFQRLRRDSGRCGMPPSSQGHPAPSNLEGNVLPSSRLAPVPQHPTMTARSAPMPLQASAGPPNPRCLIAAGGGRVASAAGSAVTLFENGSALTLKAPSTGKPIASLAVSSDGRALAAGERGPKPALLLWSLADCGRPAVELAHAQHNFGIAALAFSPGGE